MHRHSIRRLVVVLALALAGLVTLSSVAVAPAAAMTKRERRMGRMVNAARVEAGLSRLDLRRGLSRVARHHSDRMADRGYLFHTTNLLVALADWSWSLAAENVAMGGSVRQAFDALMDSPPHRRNILNGRFDRMGIGIVEDDRGYLWITQNFID